jgi:hypothetical protein
MVAMMVAVIMTEAVEAVVQITITMIPYLREVGFDVCSVALSVAKAFT